MSPYPAENRRVLSQGQRRKGLFLQWMVYMRYTLAQSLRFCPSRRIHTVHYCASGWPAGAAGRNI